MDWDNITQIIVLIALGVFFITLGLLIWKKEMIGLIHSYHYSNVPEESRKSYTKAIGITQIISGALLVLGGLFSLLNIPIFKSFLVALPIVFFLISFVIIQIKYNRGIISFNISTSKEDIKLPTTKLHIILNILSITIMAATIITVLMLYPGIPETIPTHYNAAGKIDDYGNKTTILIILAVSILTYALIFATQFFPKTWNTTFEIKPENREQSLKESKTMLLFLSLSISILFSYLMINMALCRPLSAFALPVVMGIIFIPIIVFFIRIYKLK